MKYTIEIDIPEAELEDVITSLTLQYGYAPMVTIDETTTVPAVVDAEGVETSPETTTTTEVETVNPVSLIEHIGNIISSDIKTKVKEARKQKLIAELAEQAEPEMAVNITF